MTPIQLANNHCPTTRATGSTVNVQHSSNWSSMRLREGFTHHVKMKKVYQDASSMGLGVRVWVFEAIYFKVPLRVGMKQ